MRLDDALRDRTDPREHRSRVAPRTRRAGVTPMKIRVLVAEDHPLVREGIMRALVHDPGIDVVGAAGDGTVAMALAHELEPDVMLLDLRMPGLGGAAVLERLRTELPEIFSTRSLRALPGISRRRRRARRCGRRSSRPTAAAR
jgi:CheY-like chemotaxis protein